MRSSLLLALLLVPAAASARPQAMFNGQQQDASGHTQTQLGGRATFYKPIDASHGNWAPGVQARLRLNQAYAAELSADFTHHSVGGTTVDVTPLQATLLGFFYPDSNTTPYLLLGLGYYRTKVLDASPHTSNRWGGHAGIGLSMLAGDNWTLDASYRWLWSQTYDVTDAAHPVGQHFSGQGHMLTLGLNLHL